MREVFGERNLVSYKRRASHKTDRSRGRGTAAKPRQNAGEQRAVSNQRVTPPWGQVRGQGKGALTTRLVLEKRFEQSHTTTPVPSRIIESD